MGLIHKQYHSRPFLSLNSRVFYQPGSSALLSGALHAPHRRPPAG